VGSFTDIVAALDFRPDTPPEILAAFSALERARPKEDHWWDPAPPLPAPVVEPSELWDPDWRQSGLHEDFPDEPWRHDWAALLSRSAAVDTIAHAELVWRGSGIWRLSFRTAFATWAEAVFAFIEWLGPYIYAYNEEYPLLIGYLKYDNEGRPRLLWFKDRELVLEDLNTDDTRYG
jgi:hypothetical protein